MWAGAFANKEFKIQKIYVRIRNGNRINKSIIRYFQHVFRSEIKKTTSRIKSKLKLTNLIYWVPTLIMSKIMLIDITFTFSFCFSLLYQLSTKAPINTFYDCISGIWNIRNWIPSHGTKLKNAEQNCQSFLMETPCTN